MFHTFDNRSQPFWRVNHYWWSRAGCSCAAPASQTRDCRTGGQSWDNQWCVSVVVFAAVSPARAVAGYVPAAPVGCRGCPLGAGVRQSPAEGLRAGRHDMQMS